MGMLQDLSVIACKVGLRLSFLRTSLRMHSDFAHAGTWAPRGSDIQICSLAGSCLEMTLCILHLAEKQNRQAMLEEDRVHTHAQV